jgi:hypothetical protein
VWLSIVPFPSCLATIKSFLRKCERGTFELEQHSSLGDFSELSGQDNIVCRIIREWDNIARVPFLNFMKFVSDQHLATDAVRITEQFANVNGMQNSFKSSVATVKG